MTALPRTSKICKRQTRPLVREGAHVNKPATVLTTKIWSRAPDGYLTSRHTGRLTVGRNITLALEEVTLETGIEGDNIKMDIEEI
jgi:hypothetical protein